MRAPSWVQVRRKWITGVAQRTISSTAVTDRPSKSACQRAIWSGCSVSACRPWEMALRVVSFPAATRRMKNDAISAGVRRLAIDLRRHQRRRQVVLRVLHPVLGELGDELGQILGRGEERRHHARLGLVGDVLRIAEPEDHVRAVEDELLLAAGDPHHVDDDPQRAAWPPRR